MRAIDRKLLRDLGRMKGQVVAIALIVACGLASWICVLSAYRGLRDTRDAYYRKYRFADLFAPVKRAPRSAATRLMELPGVRQVRPRITFEVLIDLPELPEPAYGRVTTLPDLRDRVINDVHLVRGRWFTGDGTDEVILGDKFARLHGLDVGDTIRVVMNNRKEALRIAALALSPEFVYMIRGGGDLIPDPEHFTVLWLSESFAESAFDYLDSANEFVATLDRDADLEQVIDDFDRELDKYGAVGAYGRRDQLSNRFLSDEIDGLRGTATVTPTVFLGVAAFVLNMLLRRLVQTQRTEISVFRAFGYSTADVTLHYLEFSLLVGGVGCALGTAVGVWFAKSLLVQYREFYQFPLLAFRFDTLVIAAGIAVSLAFSLAGAVTSARRAALLDPAEGLRPEAPAVFRRTLFERWRGFFRRLGPVWRMVLRNIARAKLRSALTVGGVTLATSIVFLSLFSGDSMDELIDFEAKHVDLHDIRVTLADERGRSALYEIRRLPGVRKAEPELYVPVRLVNGWREHRTAITGLDPEGVLRGLVDSRLRPVPRPREGLLLSSKLAEMLAVRPGDLLTVHWLEGEKTVFEVPVEGTVDEYLGANAYASLPRLAEWIGEVDPLNSARLLVDDDRRAELNRTLKDLPAVQAVTAKDVVVRNFKETLAASMNIMIGVTTVFAGVIAFGVMYNSARISFAERARTLATLRVLGYTEGETARIIMNENYLLAALGVAPGILLGMGFSLLLARAYDTELFRFPVVFREKTVVVTVVAILAFAVLANLTIRRRVRKLELVTALKSRE